MPSELAHLIRTADAMGLRGPEREQYIVEQGGSLDAYRQYTRRANLRMAGAYLALIVAVVAGVYGWWTWYDWGPGLLRMLHQWV
jgi:hypothetical protein